MTNTSASLRPNAARRTMLWLGAGILACYGCYFLWKALSTYGHFDASHYGPFWRARWWLVAHLTGGTLALTLGPFQFSTALRRRFAAAHRWVGRIYLLGVLLGAAASVYMGVIAEIKPFGMALEFLALAWVTTSAMAYLTVVRRQFSAHREWAIRSYVVTFAFVLFRFLENVHCFGSLSLEAHLVMNVWLAWAVPLLLTEVVLQCWRPVVKIA